MKRLLKENKKVTQRYLRVIDFLTTTQLKQIIIELGGYSEDEISFKTRRELKNEVVEFYIHSRMPYVDGRFPNDEMLRDKKGFVKWLKWMSNWSEEVRELYEN